MIMRTILLSALASLSLVACSDDAGTAPTIANLTYSPSTVTHGAQATVIGNFAFDDKDGDLSKLGGNVVLPDNTEMVLPKTDVSALGEMTTGTLAFQMSFVPIAAGTYRFALFVTDDGDNESNKLEGTLTAQ
jgi:hypothetical protein